MRLIKKIIINLFYLYSGLLFENFCSSKRWAVGFDFILYKLKFVEIEGILYNFWFSNIRYYII